MSSIKDSRMDLISNKDIISFDYIIIGGGIAGVSCAEQIFSYDDESSVLLLSGSEYVKTISNIQYITKTLDVFDVEEKDAKVLERKCPTVTVLRSVVTGLDSQNKVVSSKNGQFRYGKLCICSGAVPKVIFPCSPYVLWIRDTESVQTFQEKITEAKRIVIVGNGGIANEMVYEITGIEIIWAIKDKSLNAVFIDAGAAEFLRPSLDQEKNDGGAVSKRRKYTIDSTVKAENELMGGALGPDWHEGIELKGHTKRCVTLETKVEVVKILSPDQLKNSTTYSNQMDDKGNWPVYVELTNGKVYGCDFIVSATGVRPSVDVFLEGNNFSLGEDGGLLVNEKMETSLPHIYAAGDVCSAGWDVATHWFQLRLWTQARQMGCYAARCMWASMKGDEIHMDFCFEMFAHATKFFGYKVVLLGLYNGQKLDGKYEVLLRMTKGKEYIKCVMKDGRMQGALLIGETGLEETFENLILNQMDLSTYGEDLLDPNVDIEDYFD